LLKFSCSRNSEIACSVTHNRLNNTRTMNMLLHTEQDDDNDLDDGDGGDLLSFRTHLPPRTEDEDDMVIVNNNTSTITATTSSTGTTAAATASAAASTAAAAASSSEAAMARHTTEALELLISTLRSGSSALDDTGTLLCNCHKHTCCTVACMTAHVAPLTTHSTVADNSLYVDSRCSAWYCSSCEKLP
jgi:hypothetical protein